MENQETTKDNKEPPKETNDDGSKTVNKEPNQETTKDNKEPPKETNDDELVEVQPGLREVEDEEKIKIKTVEADKTKTKIQESVEDLLSKRSWGDFKLDQTLQKQIVENWNFDRPSKIQAIAAQSILSNPPKNFIGQAQSGSGKTGAFLVSAIQKIKQNNDFSSVPKVICVAPTRELARQVHFVAEKLLGVDKSVTLGLIIPSDDRRDHELKTDGHLLIGTPGKLWGLMDKKRINLSKLFMVIFDEADALFEPDPHTNDRRNERIKDTTKILKKLNQQIQYCLFSATFNEESKKWISAHIKAPKIKIEVPPNKLFVDKLKQFKLMCDNESAKEKMLLDLFENTNLGQTIIFTQTRDKARKLKELLTKDKNWGYEHDVQILTGDKNVSFAERDAIMEQFKSGRSRVLVTTNVLARGIDVLNVSLVVNFDPPETRDGSADVDTYLHRIGRSARFGRPGIALNMFHDARTENILTVIEKHYQREMELLNVLKEGERFVDWEKFDSHLQDVLIQLK